jgi:hypothetical protein
MSNGEVLGEFNFKNDVDNLEITKSGSDTPTYSEKITIPYGLNMSLSSTEFSVYDDDKTKNITFPKGLRMVIDGNNLRVWKPDIIINSDLTKQIQINYGFRTMAGSSFLLFHKPGDTINSGNSSPNMIKIPWGINLTNYNTVESRAANFEDLEWHVERLNDNVEEMYDKVIAQEASVNVGIQDLEIRAEDLGDRITALETAASNPPIQTTTSIFHQSIINHTAMFTMYNGVYATVTSNNTFPTTIKTTVRDTDPIIFPRTTNTLITMYYSSYVDNYIPVTAGGEYRSLVDYFSSDSISATPLFMKRVVNNVTPQISLTTLTGTGQTFKVYTATKETPKIVCDLTADLAAGRPGEIIKFAKFDQSSVSPYARSQADFFQDCIVLLDHVYISYSYKD